MHNDIAPCTSHSRVSWQSQRGDNKDENGGDDGGRRGRDGGRASAIERPLVQGIVDRPQEGERGTAALPAKIVRIDGPSHDAGQPLIVGELGLDPDALGVVIGYPFEPLVHVGSHVLVVPFDRPRLGLVRLHELFADFIVSQESVLTSVGSLEKKSNG